MDNSFGAIAEPEYLNMLACKDHAG